MMIKSYSKKLVALILSATMVFSVAACSSQTEEETEGPTAEISFEKIEEPVTETVTENATTEATEEPVAEQEAYVLPDDMYISELTGEPISKELQDQRPIAAMVDNEITALPHYGTAQADVVYELMNSTANDRITRLMCVVKDWGKIEQLGSIRSTRPTNILLAAEWNAVLCHDGGPYYNDQYFAKDYSAHFSGTFSRINNGKKREYTEYIVSGDLESNFNNYAKKNGYSTTYNEFANPGSHFNFVPYGTELHLEDKYPNTYPASVVTLPFPHNSSQLVYNSETGLYEYYDYGDRHEDADTGEPLAFKNVILQNCTFTQLDDHGYLIYNCIDAQTGWYLTNGVAKVISWSKTTETDVTRYYDDKGEELEINTGKTYISLIPSDSWEKVQLQ